MDRSSRHWMAALGCGLAAQICVGCTDNRHLIPLVDAGADASADAMVDGSMDAAVDPSVQLQGLWTGPCLASNDQDAGGGESTQQGFAFRNNQFVTRIERYLDATCQAPVVRLEVGGTFVVGGPVTGIGDAHELDVAIDAMTAQLLDPDYEAAANAETLLGFSDWTAGQTRDVLGVDVFETGRALGADDVIYQIFAIRSVTAGATDIPVLMLGDESGGGPIVDASQRPTHLSPVPHVYSGPAN